MKKAVIIFLAGLSFVIINSCSTSNQIVDRKLKFTLQGGANIGGITENTDMKVVPNVKTTPNGTIDAFTGATNTGFNFGMHINKPLKRNQLETGIDYMFNKQKFTYKDAENLFTGVRELNVSQVMLPVTFNFILFKKLLPGADIQLKAGYLGQLNFVSVNEKGTLPEYSINRWSNGATIGLSAFPFHFKNGSKLGFYFDGYRGTQIYKDFYNQSSFEMPGSSFMKFGLKFQFK